MGEKKSRLYQVKYFKCKKEMNSIMQDTEIQDYAFAASV